MKNQAAFQIRFVVIATMMTIATAAFAVDKQSTLYGFKGKADGGNPYSGLIADSAGNLYGTTYDGGISCPSLKTCGTVFELSPSSSGSWTETVLYSFTGGADGAAPEAGLVFDTHGNLFGTAYAGGGSTACEVGCGTIFELSPSSSGWTETTLYQFQGGTADGQYPLGSLTFDASGNLFGTAFLGGANGGGTLYELSPNSTGGWTKTTIYNFTFNQGIYPQNGVIMDSAGNLYGTLSQGGSSAGDCSNGGCGTVFRLSKTSTGWRFGLLYMFESPGGLQPHAGLVFDAAGNLYGANFYGGKTTCTETCGTVFELSPATQGQWKFSLLHSFTGGSDGSHPPSTLIIDSAGNLYGTSFGPPSTVFRISPAASGGWQFEVLATLSNASVYYNTAPLLRDAAGNLYGAADFGGSTLCKDGCGLVYELSPITTAAE